VWEYDRDLFDPPTIDRMAGHFHMLLEGIAVDPERPVGELPLLQEVERRQLLTEWNQTGTDYPEHTSIHRLFEAQAQRTPDAIAVVFEDQRLTYRQLNSRANRLARKLQALDVGPEVLVGICVERSPTMVAGLLGILKAGGTYVPLDPAYPYERLAFICEDAQVSVLLTQQDLLSRLPKTDRPVLCVDTFSDMINEEVAENPINETTAAHVAYIIYTSGSTGRPKGVAITHRSAVAFLTWAGTVFSPAELAGVLASTSICFDLSVFELFVPLIAGGKVILADSILQLPALTAAQEVRLINTVPSAMAELLRADGIPATIRTVNLAGELLTTSLVQETYQHTNVERVYDLYGPSEDTT
jgi:non-ribosomal peptide synthetase component F